MPAVAWITGEHHHNLSSTVKIKVLGSIHRIAKCSKDVLLVKKKKNGKRGDIVRKKKTFIFLAAFQLQLYPFG
jgi:hypothetical protein